VTTSALLRNLPRPYVATPDSVVGQLLDGIALQLEAVAEDIGRVRLAHWVEQAYRLTDLARLAALVGVSPLPWETPETFRARLMPLVSGRLRGSVGPVEIRRFVFEYLRSAETALGRPGDGLPAVLVPGLQRMDDAPAAFAAQPDRPRYRPLVLAENPRRDRVSRDLARRGGRVGHLQRWADRNAGLTDAPARITLTGAPGGRTTVPLLVNLTSGEWIGYGAVVPTGRRLEIAAASATSRRAVALLDGTDVSDRLLGGSRFPPDDGLRPADARAPSVPLVRRGDNAWMFASAGLFGVRGVDRTFLAFADAAMAEGAFDATVFDHAIFPVGPAAHLELGWIEREPASFEVRVPRGVTVEPAGRASLAASVGDALGVAVGELRAAGVAASVVFLPFEETQAHLPSVEPSWISLPSETAPVGIVTEVSVGGHFGDTTFGGTRFE
jgi:hypothetical protein